MKCILYCIIFPVGLYIFVYLIVKFSLIMAFILTELKDKYKQWRVGHKNKENNFQNL